MSATKYKYILIMINVLVISISILALIYVHQTENDDQVENTLIGVSLVAYTLAIFGSIAVGLENVFLLTIYALLLTIPLAASYTFLVFQMLDTFIYPDNSVVTFVNLLLSITNIVLSVQVLAAYYLVYKILIERRNENSRQYRITKALDIDQL